MRTALALFLGCLAVGVSPAVLPAADEGAEFKEVYDLIRTNAAGVTDDELNRAALEGVLASLAPKVVLVTNATVSNENSTLPSVARAELFDGVGYARISRVREDLPGAIEIARRQLASTNKLKGLVLDLRYARGDDYAAAAAAADLFLAKAAPLLDWGRGLVSSHEKTNAIELPVAVLVNHETSGAAEAFVAVLRASCGGVILGSRTAGAAMISKEFPLTGGDRLRIATTPVILGDGSSLSAQGVKPDIAVTVSPEDERAYYADAFRAVPRTNAITATNVALMNPGEETNPATRVRFNEAELVREHREGLNPDSDRPVAARAAPVSEPQKPAVTDPALVLALDLLKGLAVVREAHS